MNTTLHSIRCLLLSSRLLRSLRGACLIACGLIVATATNAKAEYTFTLVADSAGPFRNFYFPSPSLNAGGTVAFAANLDDGRLGIFTGNGGVVTTIALGALPNGSFGYPSINQAGTVAFFATEGNGVGERIVSGSGGPLTTVADASGQFRGFASGYSVSINTTGTVAFWASQDTGPAGIFINSGGTVTSGFLNSAPLFAEFNASINDNGTVAFRTSNGTGILTVADGLITTITDSSGPFNYFGRAPSLNNAGRVAFVAGINGIDGGVFGIYTGNGEPLTTIADLSGQFSYLGDFNFNQPPINAAGNVAFVAGLDAGGGGIFIGDGTTTSQILDARAPFFGSTLTGVGISPTSLNDSGQVAFYYELANGTTGIAIATPVPEPSSVGLLVFGALGILSGRSRKLARRSSKSHEK